MKILPILVCVCLMGGGMGTAMGQDKRTDSTGQLIERKFDRFKDETTVKLKPQKIREIAKPREELNLSVEATYKGERAVQPKEVVLVFDSVSENYIYHRESEVAFIIDGKRMNAGTALQMGGFPAPNLERTTLKLTVPFDKFSEITKGKSVELRLGKTEMTLTESALAAMRAFASAITGGSKGG
ncbi:MAG: hypothetical protein L0287_26500 [Anaerolineae bacterium]|nr:hypothetical protein [Anaerolineae bacterium]